MKEKKADYRVHLILLWIIILFNMLFADVFSIMIAFVDEDIIQIPGDVKIIMGIAAVITNIPILMIILSWVLPLSINKKVNILTSFLTILYVIGGGSLAFHYLIIASIEVILLLIIIIIAVKWKV